MSKDKVVIKSNVDFKYKTKKNKKPKKKKKK